MEQIVKSKIELEIENMPQEEANLLRNYFVLLIGAGIHKLTNSKMILYFDKDGLNQIATNQILWQKKCNKNIDKSVIV